MDESPEPISALHEVRQRMHDLQLPGRRIRRLQIECAVWPVAVVVAGEDAEHPLEMTPVAGSVAEHDVFRIGLHNLIAAAEQNLTRQH